MAFAIIVNKNPNGTPRTIRSSSVPLTQALRKKAESLDTYLAREIPAIEGRLARTGLIPKRIPKRGDAKSRADVKVWHAVGAALDRICKQRNVSGVRQRRWVWEAIANIHATDRILRASRGPARNHLEYCFRLGQFPRELAVQLRWAEWVYFFDSLTVRQERRADKWLLLLLQREQELDRKLFRRFSENLNKKLRKKDTSVLTDSELFKIYDSTWVATKAILEGERLED